MIDSKGNRITTVQKVRKTLEEQGLSYALEMAVREYIETPLSRNMEMPG